jgi:hypothetical protein
MPERAQVASLEALDSFRTHLIVYLERASRTLDDVSAEVTRTRLWLQSDRRTHWEAEARRRAKVLEQKQQALLSARLSNLRESARAEQAAVQKAKLAVDEAEAKLRLVKQWVRQYDSRVQPLARGVDKTRDVLARHMGQAVAYLAQASATLNAYADLSPPDPSPGGASHPPVATEGTIVTEAKPGSS